MQFYAISILLYRPFFSRSLKQPANQLGQKGSHHPHSICITAAQSIVKLLRIYRKQHTLRRTNVQSSTWSSPHRSSVYTMLIAAKKLLPETAYKIYSSAARPRRDWGSVSELNESIRGHHLHQTGVVQQDAQSLRFKKPQS